MEHYEDEERDGWMLDEVTGTKRKQATAILNKRKLSKYELDELFVSE